jgi:hypothetical protein
LDRRSALVTISLASAFLLGACAAPPWTGPDHSRAQVEQDMRTCQRQAERELTLHPDSFHGSPSELYGQNFQPPGRNSPRAIGPPGPMFDIDPVRRMLEEDRMTDACMRAKGYTPQEPPIKPSPPVRRSPGVPA